MGAPAKRTLDPNDRWDARLLRLRKANRLRPAHAALRLLARIDADPATDQRSPEAVRWRAALASAHGLNLSTGASAQEAWTAEAGERARQERAARRAQHDLEREAERRRVVAEFRADEAMVDDTATCPARDYAEWRRRP